LVLFPVPRICLCFVLLTLTAVPQISEQTNSGYRSYQVGAWGDSSSRGNLGVRAEIRTNSYAISSSHEDAFWVGSDLAGGAFIQFGYILSAHTEMWCARGEADDQFDVLRCDSVMEPTDVSDIHWFWEYWPNSSVPRFSFQFGSGQEGVNGTWHTYAIMPDPENIAWRMLLDGVRVSVAFFTPVLSESPVYVVAEQVTADPPDRLGPVEFRNMSYLDQDVWRPVKSLQVLVGCATIPDLKQCSTDTLNPYGTSAMGANAIVAGLGIRKQPDGQVLWPTTQPANNSTLTPLSVLEAAFIIENQNPLATLISRVFWASLLGVLALTILRLKRKMTRKIQTHI
jgi:hypothetical protein